MHEDVVEGVLQGDGALGAPFQVHLVDLIDEKDLAGEGRHPAGGDVDDFTQKGDIGGGQGATAGAEEVGGVAVDDQKGLVGLVHDELGGGIEILHGEFPHHILYMGGVHFDNFRDCHKKTS